VREWKCERKHKIFNSDMVCIKAQKASTKGMRTVTFTRRCQFYLLFCMLSLVLTPLIFNQVILWQSSLRYSRYFFSYYFLFKIVILQMLDVSVFSHCMYVHAYIFWDGRKWQRKYCIKFPFLCFIVTKVQKTSILQCGCVLVKFIYDMESMQPSERVRETGKALFVINFI
jgi:hypothetical protein